MQNEIANFFENNPKNGVILLDDETLWEKLVRKSSLSAR